MSPNKEHILINDIIGIIERKYNYDTILKYLKNKLDMFCSNNFDIKSTVGEKWIYYSYVTTLCENIEVINHNTNPNIKDDQDETFLHILCHNGYVSIAKLLIINY